MRFTILVFLALLLNINALSCSVGRAACVASCIAQNCATGYCVERNNKPICQCSRCADGSNVQFVITPSRKSKK